MILIFGINALVISILEICQKILKKEAVRGLPNMQTVKIMVCGACQKGKQTKVQHKNTADILISRPLEYMDLMGSTQTESIGRKEYIMIIVNDYSRYT
jgi:hypothetical protein